MTSEATPQRAAMADPGKAAQWYATKLGWRVFPVHSVRDGHCTCGNADCEHPGKHPLTKRGVHDATNDLEQIKQWWQDHPDANIALATGERSGVDVLDIDPRHYGDESMHDLERKYGEIGPTIESLTGGGGTHLYSST